MTTHWTRKKLDTNPGDKLSGLQGDDNYVYVSRWGKDQIVELANQGTDTIDMSKVAEDLDFIVNSNGQLQEIRQHGNTRSAWKH